jgi:hypothetical protein
LALPRIIFDPPLPPVWRFNDVHGITRSHWEPPENCTREIDRYVIQRTDDLSPERDKISSTDVGNRTSLEERTNPAHWNRVSAFFPSYLRVIARDNEGNTVAASSPVCMDYDSPLGTAPRLYDLESDPAEENDIAAAHPAVVDDLRSRLAEFAQRSRAAMDQEIADALGDAAQPMRKSDMEALGAAGYV